MHVIYLDGKSSNWDLSFCFACAVKLNSSKYAKGQWEF